MTPDAAAPRPAARVEEIKERWVAFTPTNDESRLTRAAILELLSQLGARDAALARMTETLGFIESAALFHPDQAWPDELKAQLRRIGKMAHEAPHAAPTSPGGNDGA